MLLGARDWYHRGPREDWRAAARDVESVTGPAFVWRGYTIEPLSFYTDHRTFAEPEILGLILYEAVPSSMVLSHVSESQRAEVTRGIGAGFYTERIIQHEGITVHVLTPTGQEAP
jgi:hypothetical protein